MSTIIIDNIGGEIIIQEPLRLVPKTLADGGVTEETDPIFTDSVAFGIDQADIDNWNNPPIVTPTTYRNEATSITLTAADIKSVIRYTGATDITVTIPENTILLESEIVIRQSGAGIITLVAEGGVVLNTSGGLNTNGQHTEIFLNNPIEQNIFDMLGGVE